MDNYARRRDPDLLAARLRSGNPILFEADRSLPGAARGTMLMIDPLHRSPKKGDIVLVRGSELRVGRVSRVRLPDVWLAGEEMPADRVVGIARLKARSWWREVVSFFKNWRR
jgi:hypothetical protein